MGHGRDEHGLVADPLEDGVAVDEDLADGLIVELGDHATGAREGGEIAGGREELVDDGACVSRRVTFDVLGDGFDVVEHLGRPAYSVVHRASRCSACSWVSEPCCSAAWMPRWIFSMT